MYLLKEGASTSIRFGNSNTFTVNDSLLIESNGCFRADVESTSSGTAATLSMPYGRSLETDFINLKDITATGGGTFNAGANSSDLGNNTGWTFTGSTYTLSLTYNYACINATGSTEVKIVPDGPTTNFWWRKIVSPYDTFNTNVDTVMASSAATYIFVSEYGTNCTLEDSVFITVRANAGGTAQIFHNNVGDEDWDNCSNWDLGYIPDSISDVTIGAGDTVRITSDTAWCRNFVNNGVYEQTGGVLMVFGNFMNNGTINQTAGLVNLNGTGDDTIGGTQTIILDSLNIQKDGSLTLKNRLEMKSYSYCNFIDGIIYTSSTDTFLFSNNYARSNGGNDSSFIDGPIHRYGFISFVFPTGKNGKWARIGISTSNPKAYSTFKAEYFDNFYSDTSNYTTPLEKVSITEYWQLDRISGSSIVQVALFYEDSVYSGITDTSSITVAKYSGSSWVNMVKNVVNHSNGKGFVLSNPVSTFSPFTFGSLNTQNYLPVDFLSIDAEWSSDDAIVSWKTASEQNNSHFEIERSFDGITFSKTGELLSKNSNSQAIISYDFKDLNAHINTPKNVYYRVKQVDFDGKFMHSPSVVLTKQSDSKLLVYPNPSKGIVNVSIGSPNGTLTVTDLFGKLVYEQRITKETLTTSLDLKHLRSGTYILQYYTRDEISTRKISVN